ELSRSSFIMPASVNKPDSANLTEAFTQPEDALANVEPRVECSYSVPSNPPTRGIVRVIKTLSLFANFFFLLAACAQTSAALVDLASLYSVSLAAISVFQSVNCVAYISGTWIGGLLCTRVNVFGLLTAFSALLMAGLAVCSFMPNVLLFFGVSGLGAVAGGAIDSIANSHYLTMWEGHRIRDSLMQGLHAAWSAGAMGLGAVLKSFLDPNLTSTKANASQLLSDDAQLPPYSGHVQFAYILFASLGAIPLCSHIGLLVWDRCGPTAGPRPADASASKDGKGGGRPRRLLAGRPALIMVAFAVSVRVFDVEAFVSSFLSSYLFYGLNWSTPDASAAFSVFFAGQFVGRLLSVIVSAFVRPLHILLANGCLIVLAGIVLGLFGRTEGIAYITSFAMGVGNSSSFPSVFLWLSEFLPITGPVSASLFLGDLVSLLSPAFGYVIETKWPEFFVCFTSGSGALSLCCLAAGHRVGLRLLAAATEADSGELRELDDAILPIQA
ncbi:hypothetical protein BOX15_Mlig012246g3, partial [Macrostomum lignano]